MCALIIIQKRTRIFLNSLWFRLYLFSYGNYHGILLFFHQIYAMGHFYIIYYYFCFPALAAMWINVFHYILYNMLSCSLCIQHKHRFKNARAKIYYWRPRIHSSTFPHMCNVCVVFSLQYLIPTVIAVRCYTTCASPLYKHTK